MSVYSYVELKVHTNVQKVGTHLNVCLIYRTYVRWKYTCLFVRAFYISIYNEHMFGRRYTIFAPPFLSLYYTISIYKRGTLFPAHSLPSHLSYPFRMFLIYSFIIYSLYREEYTFPQLFPPFPILLLYSLYIEHFSRPFFTPL